MKKLTVLFLITISCSVIFINAACAQATVSKVSDLKFASIFGTPKDDSVHTYCVLGRGFFSAKYSGNTDSLFSDWLAKHPDAMVIPVATHGPTLTGYPGSKMTYCWLVDGTDTANNYLIKNGCYAAVTMTRIQAWNELSEENKKKYAGLANLTVTVHIDSASYNTFLAQIQADEAYAKQNGLGIWKVN